MVQLDGIVGIDVTAHIQPTSHQQNPYQISALYYHPTHPYPYSVLCDSPCQNLVSENNMLFR